MATPASIRSTVSRSSRSLDENAAQVSSSISAPSTVRPRGRDTRYLAATQHHRPVGRAMPVRLAARDLGVLGTDPGGHLGVEHLGHHHQAYIGAETEQPFLHRAGQISQRHSRFKRQTGQIGRLHLGDAHDRYLLVHGGPPPVGLSWRTPDTMPKARSQAGDHRLTSTNRGTTSSRMSPSEVHAPTAPAATPPRPSTIARGDEPYRQCRTSQTPFLLARTH